MLHTLHKHIRHTLTHILRIHRAYTYCNTTYIIHILQHTTHIHTKYIHTIYTRHYTHTRFEIFLEKNYLYRLLPDDTFKAQTDLVLKMCVVTWNFSSLDLPRSLCLGLPRSCLSDFPDARMPCSFIAWWVPWRFLWVQLWFNALCKVLCSSTLNFSGKRGFVNLVKLGAPSSHLASQTRCQNIGRETLQACWATPEHPLCS